MEYNLSKEIDRARFQEKAAYFLMKESKVELVKRREKRSFNQNAYLHLVLSWLGIEMGLNLEQTKQSIWKQIICPDIFKIKVNDFDVYKSSSDLNTLEMTQAIDALRNWASIELGCYLPEPHESEILASMNNQIRSYGYREFL